jgi:hypothetical protein
MQPDQQSPNTYTDRVSGTSDYSIERLAEMFEEGYRIKVEAYDGIVVDGTPKTQEIARVLEKRDPPDRNLCGSLRRA